MIMVAVKRINLHITVPFYVVAFLVPPIPFFELGAYFIRPLAFDLYRHAVQQLPH